MRQRPAAPVFLVKGAMEDEPQQAFADVLFADGFVLETKHSKKHFTFLKKQVK